MRQKSKEVGEEERLLKKEKGNNYKEEGDEDYMPTLVSFERGVKWIAANVVPKKE